MSDDEALNAAREALKARLAEIDRVAEASAESRKPVTLDQQSVGRVSRIDAIQQQAMALATEQRRQTERRKLQAALARVDSGEYGFCVRCGDEIASARLAVDPAAPLCTSCIKGDDRR